jgi:hypothetical protein
MGWRDVLKAVLDVVFFALLDGDNDTLIAMLRKVTLTVLLPTGGVFVLGLGVYFSVMLAIETDPNAMPALAVTGFCNVVPAITWHYGYWRCRATKQATDATLNVVAWGGILWAAGILIAVPQISALLATTSVLVGLLIIDTNHLLAHLACILLLFCGGVWNFLHASYPATGMVSVPHARDGPLYERILLVMVTCSTFAFVFMGVFGMTYAARSAVDASDRALRMSITVAELLRRYDTDGVTEMLEEYRNEPGADPRILASYTALVANLNQYRPHLPNWMVDAADGEQSEAASQRTTDTRSVTASVQLSVSMRAGDVGTDNPERARLQSVAAQPSRRNVNVSYGLVDFGFATPQEGAQADAGLTDFVDRVHEWATTTHASIHGFVGDVLQVSWNATHSIAQPELKAANFMAALVKWNRTADDDATITAAAAVFSGPAVCRFSGSGRVQALTLATTWRPTLQRCLQFAAEHRAVLMDSATHGPASICVESYAVEVVPPDTAGVIADTKPIELFEVGAELQDDCDEWMYVLQRKGVTDCDRVTTALRAAVEGDVAGALCALDEVTAAAVSGAPLVQRLRGRVEAALSNDCSAVVPSLD